MTLLDVLGLVLVVGSGVGVLAGKLDWIAGLVVAVIGILLIYIG